MGTPFASGSSLKEIYRKRSLAMSLARIARPIVTAIAAFALFALVGSTAHAFPRFAKKEGVACGYCHVAEGGGGARNFRGIYYKAHKLSFADFDETFESKSAGVDANSKGDASVAKTPGYPNVKVPAVLNFVVKDIDGKPVNLGRYAGKVIMFVNVASKCGNTPQYAPLEALYKKYKSKGLVILGFPANDFGMQEPGTDKEIKEFCSETYKVDFPMFSKITVKGEMQAPVYKYLTEKDSDPKFGGPIEWNFAKFLVNRKGEIIDRIPAKTHPDTPEIVAEIEKALAEETPEKVARR
jgi:glutathione peroxidase